MATPDLIDFDSLVRPFDGTPPTGTDPRRDTAPYPAYQELKDQRGKARRAERDAEAFEGDETLSGDASAAWSTVIAKSKMVLTTQAKDLEVIAYLTEALIRKHGFAGLRDGIKLTRLCIEAFWDDLYPHVGEEGGDPIAARVKPLADLNGEDGDGTLIGPLRKVPIALGDDPGSFGFWQYLNATEIRRDAQMLDKIRASARTTRVEDYRTLIEDLTAAMAEWAALTTLLAGLCGEAAAPPSSRVRNLLTDIHSAVRYLTEDLPSLRAMFAEAAPAPADTTGGEGTAAAAAAGGGGAAAPGVAIAATIRSREDALETLLKIARFFRETEPHSPVSYTLEDLVRRARMPFFDLLKELVPDASARSTLLTRAGIAPPPDTEGY